MQPILHLLCGKVAAGKSTLAARLARESGGVVVSEDEWLSALFRERMSTIRDMMHYSGKLRAIMGPHVLSLLEAGMPVVLDFAANTIEQRAWMRGLVGATHAPHTLHVLDVPDDLCLARLRARNASGEHPFAVTEEQFRLVNSYFDPPTADEGFEIVAHRTLG